MLLVTACGGSAGSEEERGLTLQAVSVADGPIRDSDLNGAVAILEVRLERAGVDATVTRRDERLVVVELDGDRQADVERAVELATSRGVLELYDLEANLIGPSIDDNGFAVATHSLYDLLVGEQSATREEQKTAWYLFDSDRNLAGGPAPTKSLLLPGGKLPGGWRILGTPVGSVVLECGIGATVCPGVNVESPKRDFYYLIRYRAPELDGGDLQLAGTRQDFDTTTGEPIVTMQFTDEGGDVFGEITDREADRGRGRFDIASREGSPIDWFQHFAIVLDRRIKSWPSIDFEQYPNGISGSNGVQITGIGDIGEANDLALVLQTGALPVAFEVVSRPAGG